MFSSSLLSLQLAKALRREHGSLKSVWVNDSQTLKPDKVEIFRSPIIFPNISVSLACYVFSPQECQYLGAALLDEMVSQTDIKSVHLASVLQGSSALPLQTCCPFNGHMLEVLGELEDLSQPWGVVATIHAVKVPLDFAVWDELLPLPIPIYATSNILAKGGLQASTAVMHEGLVSILWRNSQQQPVLWTTTIEQKLVALPKSQSFGELNRPKQFLPVTRMSLAPLKRQIFNNLLSERVRNF